MTKREETLKALLDNKQGICRKTLSYMTNQSDDGLRGRISELRKKGYRIELITKEVKAYRLVPIWSKEEVMFLKRNIFTMDFLEICKKLNKPWSEVVKKGKEQGLIWRDRIHMSDGRVVNIESIYDL